MKLFMRLMAVCLCLSIFCAGGQADAKKPPKPEKIIFIPHDNRPISDEQTADTIRKLGYDVVVPPDNLLGGRENLGDPDKLWDWLENETGIKKNSEKKQNIKAVIMSGDSMIYGSLVASRKHDIPKAKLMERVQRFKDYKTMHPKLDMYVWSSIMRTPRNGDASGDEEPSYYKSYGADIFRYTALKDKADSGDLSYRERKEYAFLSELLPKEAMDDWLARRNKNFAVNKALIDLTRSNTFNYFALGRDDNAPYSQTHMESRRLNTYAIDLGTGRFQNMAGIDEFGLLVLTRAVNNLTKEKPFVFVKYNWGEGPRTIPAYSDEAIDKTIREHINCAGGVYVPTEDKADFVLLVNTRPDGYTSEANWPENTTKLTPGDKYFVGLVSDYMKTGKPVAVADIAFANGSDNALMEELKNRGLLYKLQAYAGWNTPTNSAGFVLGQAMLGDRMSDDARRDLLITRYLDDWAYQANVRQIMARQLGWFRGSGFYSSLGDKRDSVETRSTKLLQRFIRDNLLGVDGLDDYVVRCPWNRMFEAYVGPAKDGYKFLK